MRLDPQRPERSLTEHIDVQREYQEYCAAFERDRTPQRWGVKPAPLLVKAAETSKTDRH